MGASLFFCALGFGSGRFCIWMQSWVPVVHIVDNGAALCNLRRAPLRSCPYCGQLPMMSLSQFATSEPKGVFQVATNCRNWRRAGRPNFGRANPSVAVRISDFYHSSATVAELERRCGTGLCDAILGVFSPALIFSLRRGWGGFCGRWRGLHCCVLFLNVKTVDIF